MAKFRIVTQDANGAMTQIDFSFAGVSDDVARRRFIFLLNSWGYAHTGYKSNPNQRAELQGSPVFKGLHGAMWDGDAIRYECPDAYETLSA